MKNLIEWNVIVTGLILASIAVYQAFFVQIYNPWAALLWCIIGIIACSGPVLLNKWNKKND